MDESVVKHLEDAVADKPLLSHAIREGAKLRPQCRGRLFLNGGSCAIGAAIHHVTGVAIEPYYDGRGGLPGFVFDTFSVTMQQQNMIIEMNDRRLMTREAIADVVEQWGF